MRQSSPPLRVALYSGLLASGDAVGRSLLYKASALAAAAARREVELRIYCQRTNLADPSIVVLPGLDELIADDFFAAADLHVYEFGWHFDLFDSLLLRRPASRALVFYHGITPAELLGERIGHWASIKQKANLLQADLVCCASPYTIADLADFGVPAERLVLQPLPLSFEPSAARAPVGDGIVRLLSVARLVPHKGGLDLLQAMDRLARAGHGNIRLAIAGDLEGSRPDHIAAMRRFVAEHGLSGMVEFLGAIRDDALLSLRYAAADAAIFPSYNETYCLPVLEAFAHGCHVIAYDSTVFPHITNGLARLVPTGDVGALADAIAELATALTAAPDSAPRR